MLVYQSVVGGWAPFLEKYEFVNWDDEIPNVSGKNVPKHHT